MNSRPLSSFIPTQWTQQKRPASVHSQSSQKSLTQLSTSWSFDQLSFYARKASNTSISLLTANTNDDNKKKKQTEKLTSSKLN
jgi:hypothetical protein